jgi:hypothetical protein
MKGVPVRQGERVRLRRWVTVAVAAAIGLGAVALGGAPAGAIITAGDGGGTGGTVGCINTSSAHMSTSVDNPLYGQPFTVSWSGSIASDCWSVTLYYPDGSSQDVAASGSIVVQPPIGTQTWRLRVDSPNGSTQLASLSVTVAPLPMLPGAALARGGAGKLDLVAVNNVDGVTIQSQTAPNGSFGAAGSFGFKRSVAAETDAAGRVELFATDGSAQIFHTTETGVGAGAWNGWSQLDGLLISVAVARNADGRLELFGANSSGNVFRRLQLTAGASGTGASGWGSWYMFDGALREVAAETNSDGRVELFGINSAGGIYHRWQTAPNSDSWSDWVNIPGWLSSIAVARNADGRLEIFGTDTIGQLRYATQTTPGASTLTDFGVIASGHGGPLTAETDASGRIELVGYGDDGMLDHRAQVTPNSNDWTGWTALNRRSNPSQYLVTCTQVPSCQIADVSGDGRADLVTVDTSSGDVLVSVANPASPGDFAGPQPWAYGLCPAGTTCQFGDVNGGGVDAVVFRTSGPDAGTGSVALSTGTYFLTPTVWSSSLCTDLSTCVLGDVNGDRRADVVAFRRSSVTAVNDGNAYASISNGSNGFSAPTLWSSNICLADQRCAVADVNGDTWDDAVALVTSGANQGQVMVALNNGTGFAATQVWTSSSPCVGNAICAVVDFTKDGRADVVAKSPTDTGDGQVWVAASNGAAFAAATKVSFDPNAPAFQLGNGRHSCDQLAADAMALSKAATALKTIAGVYTGNGFGFFSQILEEAAQSLLDDMSDKLNEYQQKGCH